MWNVYIHGYGQSWHVYSISLMNNALLKVMNILNIIISEETKAHSVVCTVFQLENISFDVVFACALVINWHLVM